MLVFGFFTIEKGQDVAIQAMTFLERDAKLVLAGSVRRPEDRPYFEECKKMIQVFGLQDCVEIIEEYISEERIRELYAEAEFAIAPFRETSGSASLAQGFSHGKAILASNLKLNAELVERVPGCLRLFKALDPVDCASEMEKMLDDAAVVEAASRASAAYAEKFSAKEIARLHREIYEELIG